jgi:hypothetical protein
MDSAEKRSDTPPKECCLIEFRAAFQNLIRTKIA